MKNLRLLSIILILCNSCTITKYTCQYFETSSSNVKLLSKEDKIKYQYEDSLIIIDYNLWSSGGTVLFSIYNKSDVPIYVNWKNSNFIFKGYNNEYWSDQIISEKTTFGYAKETTKGTGLLTTDVYNNIYLPTIVSRGKYRTITNFSSLINEVTTVRKQNPSIQIPPKSYNIINKFSLNMPLIKLGDSSSVVTFDNSNTPLIFRNYLAISKDKNFDKQFFIDNEFWIDKIHTNIIYGDDRTLCYIDEKKTPKNFYIYNQEFVADPERTKRKTESCVYPCLGFSAIGTLVVMFMALQ